MPGAGSQPCDYLGAGRCFMVAMTAVLPEYLDPLDPRRVRFARVVCVNTGDPNFPIRRLGSGVVVSFEGEFFLLTARHVFENNDGEPRETVIPLLNGARDWWPTNAVIYLDAVENFAEDDAFGDLAVFSLDHDRRYLTCLQEHDSVPLGQFQDDGLHTPLFVLGHPDVGASLNLDEQTLESTLHTIEGEYGGPSCDFGLHIFKSDYLRGADPNGLSGSPVTMLDLSRVGRHLLAGLVLRGGANSGVLRFIGPSLLQEAMRYAVPRLRRLRPQ